MSVCSECQLDHLDSSSQAIEWHCKNPCQYCNWSLEFRHENFCPIALAEEKSVRIVNRSGQYLKVDSDETGRYDMATYAFALEFLRELRLSYLWSIEPQEKGIILTLHKGSQIQKITIHSIISLQRWGESLKEIAI